MMDMGTAVIVGVLIVIVMLSVRSSLKHFKGQGGCCGGADDVKPEKKVLEGEKIAEKILHIEGMHCENCQNSVERQLNRIDGVVAKASYKKKNAVVMMDREVDDEELIRAVARADYQVVEIES